MFVWTGKKIDHFEIELYGIASILGWGAILFPDIAILALGIQLKSKNVTKILKMSIRFFGVIVFLYGWYLQYLFSGNNRNFNMGICIITELGMFFLKFKNK